MSQIVARDFAVAKDALARELRSISDEANNSRMMCLSKLTSELNQILSQTVIPV